MVWASPRTIINIFSEIIADCLGPVKDVSPGMMVLARITGSKVRRRVVEEGMLSNVLMM